MHPVYEHDHLRIRRETLQTSHQRLQITHPVTQFGIEMKLSDHQVRPVSFQPGLALRIEWTFQAGNLRR